MPGGARPGVGDRPARPGAGTRGAGARPRRAGGTRSAISATIGAAGGGGGAAAAPRGGESPWPGRERERGGNLEGPRGVGNSVTRRRKLVGPDQIGPGNFRTVGLSCANKLWAGLSWATNVRERVQFELVSKNKEGKLQACSCS